MAAKGRKHKKVDIGGDFIWSTKDHRTFQLIFVHNGSNHVDYVGFIESHDDKDWVVYRYDEFLRHIFLGKVRNKNTAKSMVRRTYKK